MDIDLKKQKKFDRQEKQALSRRGFLQAAAFGLAGVTAANLLNGCTDSTGTGAGTQSGFTDASNQDFEVFDTEILIIGTGNSALAAAWQALKEDCQIAMVDKGVFRHSGPSGWSWGCYSFVDNPAEVEDMSSDLVNMPLWKNVLTFFQSIYDVTEINNPVYQINHGQTIVGRVETGAVANVTPTSTGIYSDQYFRREMDQLTTKSPVTIYDNTMITELFINGDTCYGALGYHIPSGKFRVFRAKSTVIAAGSGAFVYGWLNTKAVSLSGAENTGDMTSICYRNGLAIGENEWGFYDFSSTVPRVAFFCQVGADAAQGAAIVDKNGEPVFSGPVSGAAEFAQTIAKVVLDGRGSPNGGAYIDYGNARAGEFYIEQKNKFQKKFFGLDFRSERVEVVAEQFERSGSALTDENLMTEKKGLFEVRGAGMMGTRRAFNSTILKLYGTYAGHTAARYAKDDATDPANLDWQVAMDEYKRLTEIRTKTVPDGIRPDAIRENIQKTCYTFDGIIRTKEALEAAIKEYERIRAEDMPKMALADHSVNWNREWREAVETEHLLNIAEMTARATLMREESRGQYLRLDFPEIDDMNWKCMILCRNNAGSMELSKYELPKL